ncbi:MAG: hypothetical protein DRK00_03230 [Thermoprotei archaeon]|nr:MAG: hypothetical protein DRK00_03230 [Thermoprotei archaeon]
MQLPQSDPEALGFNPERLARLDQLVKYHIRRGCYPGAVLLVARHGRIVYLKAFGYSSLYPRVEEMRVDTLFDLASLTKVVATTTIALRLVEEGLISLDDPVSAYIPAFSGGAKDKVRLWHLLTHTSGLPAYAPLFSILASREEVTGYISGLKLEYEPGTRVVYSDLGFILLGEILEKVAGEPLDKLAKELIFKPLEMRNTTYNPPLELRERAAATEYCKYRRRILRGEVHDENAWFMGGVAGHAGLFSTAQDLAVFAQMMLNRGEYGGVRVLSPASVECATRNHTEGLGERRGLGWALNTRPCSCGDLMSPKAYGHTGFTGVSLWIDPVYDLFVIFLTNRVHPTRENRCLISARRLIHNVVMGAITDI